MSIDEIEAVRRVMGKSISEFSKMVGVHPVNYRKMLSPPDSRQHREPSERLSLLVDKLRRDMGASAQ